MKNNYLKTALLLFSACLANLASSQNLVSTFYTFTTSTSTYSTLSGGSVLGTNANDDDIFNAVPLGFTFNFLGNNYTNVSICSNGYLKFGTVINVFATNPITFVNSDDSLVCALGSDLQSISTGTATGVLSHTTLGISPNRTFVVQWQHYTSFGNTDDINFQIRLYETTNKIDVIYGGFNLSSAFICQVGLRGISASDFNNRSVVNGTNTWSTSVAGLNNSDYCELDPGSPVFRPASGIRYIWSPALPCSGTPTLVLSASSNSICSGSSSSLTVNGATSYTWNTAATTSVIVVSPTVTSIYTVTGSNGVGCNSTRTIQITLNTTPTLAASNATICSGGSTVITASGATSYVWNTGATTASISLSPTVTTNYTVIGNNATGCSDSKTLQISVVSSPTLSAANRTICIGTSTVLTAIGATSYTWSTGAITASISVSPTITTTYTVSGSNVAGCINTRTLQVIADRCLSINGIGSSSYNIAVYPNPFNEELTVSTNETINVQFFNTLGQLVMETNINKTDVINTQGFYKGIYHVVITDASSTKTFKVIKE